MKVLKYIANDISPILSIIFNLIIETGIYSDALKVARVRPIHKTGNHRDVNN